MLDVLALARTLPRVSPSSPPPLLPPYGADPDPFSVTPNRGVLPEQVPASTGGDAGATGWEVLGGVALVLVSLALSGIAWTTLLWMLHAWRTPQALLRTRFSTTSSQPRLSFSLLVPARHEQDVIGPTLDSLASIDHPAFEIIAIVGHDDLDTELAVRTAAARHPQLIRVVVDHTVPKNKPKALNRALSECRGDIVGVFDAEDEVHPELLRLVDTRFAETSADVVQGGVQLMNVHTSWWSIRNCLEYYFWFCSRLHFHAQARFIPLGGNTVFIRTTVLRDADGWDATCLAEDCELGVRLSAVGASVAVAYDPEVATREETPGSLPSLYRQRTRWSQGFLQVLRKGAWRELPTSRQRLLARYTLAMPFLQACSGVMVPVSVVLVLFAKVDPLITLVTFLPLVPTLVTLAVEVAGLSDFGRQYGIRLGSRDYLRLVLGAFPYQVLLSGAAIRAALRELRGERNWEKTAHANAHRSSAELAAR